LLAVEGYEADLRWFWRDVERRSDVPQIRAPQVACLQRSRQLAGQRPIRQDPIDHREHVSVELLLLAGERRA
jgi:hypothetical protein